MSALVSILGWCAFGFTVVMCLHFGIAWLPSDKPPLNRQVYLKTALVLAVQIGWALSVSSFNKLHLLWLYWPTVRIVATLVGNWASYFVLRPMGMPAPLPLPPLTTALGLVVALLWLLS